MSEDNNRRTESVIETHSVKVRIFKNNTELVEGVDFTIDDNNAIMIKNLPTHSNITIVQSKPNITPVKQVSCFDYFLKRPKNIKSHNLLPSSGHFGSKRKKGNKP